jgi:hypothetical protein
MTELDPNKYVPTFTEEDVKRDAVRDSISREGLYQCVVSAKYNRFSKGIERTYSKDGSFIEKENPLKVGRPNMEFHLAPLAKENDIKSIQKGFALRHYVVTPFPVDKDFAKEKLPAKPVDENDEAAKEFWAQYGAKTKQYGGMMEEALRRLLGSDVIPDRPRKEGGRWMFKGQPIDETQISKCSEEVSRISKEVGTKVWTNEMKVFDTGNPVACYVEVKLNSRDYPEVKRVHATKPGDMELVPFAEWGMKA